MLGPGWRIAAFAGLAVLGSVYGASAQPALRPLDAGAPIVALWPNGAPGAERRRGEPEVVENTYLHNVHNPSLTVFRADPRHADGAAVIVIPGGGHRMLVWINEGVGPAKMLNRYGVTAFVLKYRLARESGSTYSIVGDAAIDARRAVRWVRAHAADYGVDPHRVGLMGFSAGGELVSLVADNPAPATPLADAVDKVSGRPDFEVLVYPGPLGTPGKAVSDAPRLHHRRLRRSLLRHAGAAALRPAPAGPCDGRAAHVRRPRPRLQSGRPLRADLAAALA
jgi:acetyl esterase/lipase